MEKAVVFIFQLTCIEAGSLGILSMIYGTLMAFYRSKLFKEFKNKRKM